MSAPPLIFICYAGPDRPIAIRVHRALDARGMRPWCDAVDLAPGERWDEAIPRALKQAAAVLVLVTDRWPVVGDEGAGWYGPDEVAVAIDHARRVDPRMAIVPARLDGAGPERLPYGLRRLVEIEAAATDPAPIVAGLTRALARRALTDPAVPALNQRLADAQKRVHTLEAQGAARAAIEAAITDRIAIKRSLRAGGQLVAGDALDRYVLAERLGHGGFASVWRAWDPTRQAHVAVKVLHGRWNRDASKVERFRRGVEQMARLNTHHPAVVPVLDANRVDNGWHFFVMAWMPGGDLFRAITRADAPLSADEGLRAVLEVADALAVAHGRGMVHRDVKPRNILLDADGRAKLSDFDLVRALDTSGGTGTGAMGTFLYAAPEQLDRPQDVGPRTDVYALGMTAVFVLSGRQPATMTKWQPAAAVAQLQATPAVRACLLRAIALDEAGRPADAAAFAAELRGALAPPEIEVPADASTDRPEPTRAVEVTPAAAAPPPDTRPGSDRWQRLAVALAVLMLGALGALGALGVLGSGAEAPDAALADPDAAVVDAAPVPRIPDAGGAEPPTDYRPAMVPIAPGAFTMGSPEGEAGRFDRERAHRVRLTRGFLMAETEVTQAQYAALMGTNPAYFQGAPEDGRRPVENVSWLDAVKYCNALSKKEGLAPAYAIEGEAVTWDQSAGGYRLPTEAEWEYAARAGTATATYAGDLDIRGEHDAPVLDDIAWYGGNSGSTHPKAVDSSSWEEKQRPHERASTHPVKGKQPNGWGLYDMLGNVWEWTWDRYAAEYPEGPAGAPLADPAGPARGAVRVIRGGSFYGRARWVRSAYRDSWSPGVRYHWLGFRPVRAPRAP